MQLQWALPDSKGVVPILHSKLCGRQRQLHMATELPQPPNKLLSAWLQNICIEMQHAQVRGVHFSRSLAKAQLCAVEMTNVKPAGRSARVQLCGSSLPVLQRLRSSRACSHAYQRDSCRRRDLTSTPKFRVMGRRWRSPMVLCPRLADPLPSSYLTDRLGCKGRLPSKPAQHLLDGWLEKEVSHLAYMPNALYHTSLGNGSSSNLADASTCLQLFRWHEELMLYGKERDTYPHSCSARRLQRLHRCQWATASCTQRIG